MNKIYTSVLCMVLLVPTLARAEICTDFDDNMNIIEFDCSEGAAAARKRIAAEREKVRAAAERQAEQERIAAEKAATAKRQAEEQRKAAEREKQRELERVTREKQRELERLEREKQENARLAEQLRKTEERLEKEKVKRKELEKEQEKINFFKDGSLKYVVGLGVSGWSGPSVTADAFAGRDVNGWIIWNADYDASGIGFTPSFGLRYYFGQNAAWFAQASLSIATGFMHDVKLNNVQKPIGSGSGKSGFNSEVRTNRFTYIDGLIGRQVWDRTSVYGRLGVGSLSYDITDFQSAYPDFDTDATAVIFGFGLEHRVWKALSAYTDISLLAGDFFLGDTFLKLDLGVRYQF